MGLDIDATARPSVDSVIKESQPGPSETEQPEASSSKQEEHNTEDSSNDDDVRCPLCQYIEAGACKPEHDVWDKCRKGAEAEGRDYVEECAEHFQAFFTCMMHNMDYYAPVLELFGALPPPSESTTEATLQSAESAPAAAAANQQNEDASTSQVKA